MEIAEGALAMAAKNKINTKIAGLAKPQIVLEQAICLVGNFPARLKLLFFSHITSHISSLPGL